MTNAGKAKGNGWEREIAKFLTELYDESFLRVPSSGGYIGGKNASRIAGLSEEQVRIFKSDIIPGPSFPNLNIEGKFYKSFPFHQLVQGKCKQIDTWISQLLTASEEQSINILAMKFNNKGSFLAFEKKNVPPFIMAQHYIRYNSPNYGPWIIQDFKQFWHDNKDIVKAQK